MKTIYKMVITALYVVLMISLSGCQLAKEEAHEDKIIGALITTESLGHNDPEYDGRLYAEKRAETSAYSETGKSIESDQYVFPGIYGISLFSVTTSYGEDVTDNLITCIADPEVSNPSFTNPGGGGEEGISVEGTIYLSSNSQIHIFYVNPVYQSEDGSVYATGQHGFAADAGDEGLLAASTLKESYLTTEGSESKEEKFSLVVSFFGKFPTDKIVILQFDIDHNLIQSEEYTSDNIPEDFNPGSNTAYLIVEDYHKDELDNESISRAIYSQGAETFETFIANDYDICVKQETLINWPSN